MFVKYIEDEHNLVNLDQIIMVRLDVDKKTIFFDTLDYYKAEYKSDFYDTPDGEFYLNWSFMFPDTWYVDDKYIDVDDEMIETIFERLCMAIARKETLFDISKAAVDYVEKNGLPINE